MTGDKSSTQEGRMGLSWLVTIGLIFFLVGLPLYLAKQDQNKKLIKQAWFDYGKECNQKGYALYQATLQVETSAVLEKAGIDPVVFYAGGVPAGEARMALEKTGLLDDFAAADKREKQKVADAEKVQEECRKKVEEARAYLEKNNALPKTP